MRPIFQMMSSLKNFRTTSIVFDKTNQKSILQYFTRFGEVDVLPSLDQIEFFEKGFWLKENFEKSHRFSNSYFWTFQDQNKIHIGLHRLRLDPISSSF